MWDIRKPATYLIVSVLLVIYGTYGILTDNFVTFGHRSRHLHGLSAWGLYFGFIAFFLLMLSNFLEDYYTSNGIDSPGYSPKKIKWLGYCTIFISLCLSAVLFIVK